MPARYRRQSLLEFFDERQISMRYVHYYTGMPDPVAGAFSPKIKIRYIRSIH